VDSQFRVGIELFGTTERALRCDSVLVRTIIEDVPAPQDKRAASSRWQSHERRRNSIGTHRTALLVVHRGAITRGLQVGGGLRRILRGASLGKPRWPARWRASFIIGQSWAPLLDESTALSGAGPRPQRAQSRTTTQRARMLQIAAGSGHIGNLQSTHGTTRSIPGTPPWCD
jgi:hypothetical protein